MNFALDAGCEALQLPSSARERVSFVGDDALRSVFRVTDLAAGSIGVAALALSELVARADPAPRVVVDRRLAFLWFGTSLVPRGWSVPAPWDAIAGDYAARDGWIRLRTNAPAHRAAALRVLGGDADRTDVADAVRRFDADVLEAAIVDVGGCAATMRSVAAWAAHPQGNAVAAEPLIAISNTPCPRAAGGLPEPGRPLAGLRVLDLTRVLAGPVATRFLAGFGAEVLRIDPPGWDEPGVIPEVTLGKRCARLDLERHDDHATGYLIAAAVVAGVTRRFEGTASTARLSLARVAKLLIDAGPQGGASWSERTDDDLAQPVEDTPWGPAVRVKPPVRVDGAPMAWTRGATTLGSAEARWVDRA